ncbi:MAG TPA: M43 family zinc metalloprotease [Chitinophagaceae bacterium]|nr:M43 family zinc metalloprotease [Chitinophagaceae bacterium]
MSPKSCGTMNYLEDVFSKIPGSRAQFEASQAELERRYQEQIARIVSNSTTQRFQAITTIPVVVHIILPDASIVTDLAVQDQINILNADYSGLNPDSTNATNFYPVRGHPEIRFCLAQRTPTNLPTNGIERRNASTQSEGSVLGDNIKYTADGGLDAWDPNKYLNIWVCATTPPAPGVVLLGYATFPGAGFPLVEHGAVIHYRSFSSINPTGTTLFAFAAKGRTSSHELGHFFNLRHIWGDQSGCTTDDLVSDTPLQDVESAGCPSGTRFDACTPGGTGINYQNYMDYSDDPCLTMFTVLQGVRMQAALSDPTRIGLTTSNGCVPLTLTPDDASIFGTVTPSAGFVTCDPTVPLTVTLRNAGSNTLTSVRITVTRNGTPIQTFNWTGSLTANNSVAVPLNPVSLVLGANAIQICTSLPNGNADSGPANDCFTVNGIRGAGTPLPLVEGFESATFPPTGWIRNNPDGGITWQRTTVGVAHTGVGKAFVDHFNYPAAGNNDDLRTPPFAIGTADSLWVSFWGAYRGFPGFPFDQFQVMVSTDCGQTFQVVYNARNDTAFVAPEGATPTFGAGGYFPTNVNEWTRKSLDLSGYIPTGNIMVQFRAINQFGNNMHLDDINIDKKTFFNNDAGVIAVNKPAGRICTGSDAPVVVIKNYGKINLTSVKINYQVDGGPVTIFNWTGNLARNQTASVTLATANLGAIGNHTINVFTTLPNNVTDQDPSNDGLVKSYTVSQVFALPGTVTEEFTSSTFPPVNWSIINPNADITWQRNGSIGNRNAGSAYFNDFVNTTVDRYDDLAMPNYSYSGIDSIFLSFNLAHITKKLPGTTGARLDTLTVLLSKDCGNTFTTIYKKYGEELQTVNDPNFQISLSNFVPLATQWRKDSVNLGKWLNATEPLFQLMFRFSGNMENNFYLDDVNIRSQILPAKLKNDGYLILPNPFRNTFGVWHYQVPTNLRYVNVYNSVGQLVYSKKFPSGGEKYFQVDLGGRAAGTYTVNLGYEDSNRNVSVQVVKY